MTNASLLTKGRTHKKKNNNNKYLLLLFSLLGILFFDLYNLTTLPCNS